MTDSQFKFSIDGKFRPFPKHTCLWSSRDTSWAGLPADCLRNDQSVDLSASFYAPRPMVALFLSGESSVRWHTEDGAFEESIKPGMMIFLDKSYQLSQLTISGGSEIVIVELNEPMIHRWLDADPTSFSYIQPHIISSDSRVKFLIKSICDEISGGCRSGSVFAESISVALVTYLQSHYSAIKPIVRASEQGLPSFKLRMLHDYIHDDIGSDHSVEELAEKVGLSPSHFCRSFKQATGISPYQYVLQARVDRAKSMLAAGVNSVSEIALVLGFSSQSHFSDVFRKQVGMSPTTYIKQR